MVEQPLCPMSPDGASTHGPSDRSVRESDAGALRDRLLTDWARGACGGGGSGSGRAGIRAVPLPVRSRGGPGGARRHATARQSLRRVLVGPARRGAGPSLPRLPGATAEPAPGRPPRRARLAARGGGHRDGLHRDAARGHGPHSDARGRTARRPGMQENDLRVGAAAGGVVRIHHGTAPRPRRVAPAPWDPATRGRSRRGPSARRDRGRALRRVAAGGRPGRAGRGPANGRSSALRGAGHHRRGARGGHRHHLPLAVHATPRRG